MKCQNCKCQIDKINTFGQLCDTCNELIGNEHDAEIDFIENQEIKFKKLSGITTDEYYEKYGESPLNNLML